MARWKDMAASGETPQQFAERYLQTWTAQGPTYTMDTLIRSFAAQARYVMGQWNVSHTTDDAAEYHFLNDMTVHLRALRAAPLAVAAPHSGAPTIVRAPEPDYTSMNIEQLKAAAKVADQRRDVKAHLAITDTLSKKLEAERQNILDCNSKVTPFISKLANKTDVPSDIIGHELKKIVTKNHALDDDDDWRNNVSKYDLRQLVAAVKELKTFMQKHDGKTIGETLLELSYRGNNQTPPIYYGWVEEHYTAANNTDSFSRKPCEINEGDDFLHNGYLIRPFTVHYWPTATVGDTKDIRAVLREEQYNRTTAATEHAASTYAGQLSTDELRAMAVAALSQNLLYQTTVKLEYDAWLKAGAYIDPNVKQNALQALKPLAHAIISQHSREDIVAYLKLTALNTIEGYISNSDMIRPLRPSVSVQPSDDHGQQIHIDTEALTTAAEECIKAFNKRLMRNPVKDTQPVSKVAALKILDGDHSSRSECKQHKRELKAVVGQRLRSEAEAEDLVGEVAAPQSWKDRITMGDVKRVMDGGVVLERGGRH